MGEGEVTHQTTVVCSTAQALLSCSSSPLQHTVLCVLLLLLLLLLLVLLV
jgi:hypothetical protein